MHSIHLPHPPRASASPSAFAPRPSPLTPRIAATPPDQWPAWTRIVTKFRREKDTGLGDTLVHLIGDARSDRFKKWFTRKFGKTCGCTQRQRWLNQKFPYPVD